MECLVVYTKDIEKLVNFYQSLGLINVQETYQDIGKNGDSELVLKNNPELNFAETEIVVEDVRVTYETLKSNTKVEWIRTPFANSLGGDVAVMKAPDDIVFVLVGK